MRVTIVSPFDPMADAAAHGRVASGAHLGGVERCLGETARALAHRGHDVTVVCSADPGTSAASAVTSASDAIACGLRIERRHRWGTVLRAPVWRSSGIIPPGTDIVHVPATYPFTTATVLREAARKGVPSVLDYHFEPHPAGPLGRAAAHAYRHLGPRHYRLADAVLVRSHAYARSCASLADIPVDRWRVIPNGVDLARFHPAVPPTGSGNPAGYILFVGRLVPYKGVHVLLRALARMPAPPPLVVAGDGPLRPSLQALAQRLGVAATFLGAVQDDALPGLYAGARLTVLPSVSAQEAFGITLLESMACGTPVLASDLPGVADVARLGGSVCRPDDDAALAQAITQALANPQPPQRGALARIVAGRFGWPAVAMQVEAVYQEVLDGRQGCARGGQHDRAVAVLRSHAHGHASGHARDRARGFARIYAPGAGP